MISDVMDRIIIKVKQSQCGPEGSRRFRFPDFMTFST
jgi:hypothetical protein